MSHPHFQLSYYASGEYYPAVLDTIELQRKIEADNSLRDMNWQIPARAWPGAATDLTFPLFTKDFPQIRLNRLYYPEEGVMQWGYCYMAFTGTQIEAIKAASPSGTITLQTNNDTADKLEFAKFTLVASIPLWEVGKTPDSGRITEVSDEDTTLHLALFADERFWVANYSANVDIEQVPSTWKGLISACLAAMPGISVSSIPDVDEAYGSPSQYSDWIEAFQYNAAVMLDAALTNAGLLLVRDINGTYTILTLKQGHDREAAVTHSGHYLRAGGGWDRNGRGVQYLGTLPNSVTCQFPVWDEAGESSKANPFAPAGGKWLWEYDDPGMHHLRSPLSTSYYYPVDVTLSDAFDNMGVTAPNTAGMGTKIIRETARACGDANTDNEASAGSPYAPKNLSILRGLALTIASDYYFRKIWSMSQETWNGFVKPSSSGWNYYTYYMGLDCWTKISGDPANAEYEQLMHDVECEASSSESESESGSGSESESESESGSGGSESESESGGCITPDQMGLAGLPDYDPTIRQVLGHDEHNCMRWMQSCCDCPSDWSDCLSRLSANLAGPAGICYDLTGVTLEFDAAGHALVTAPPSLSPCASVEGWITCTNGMATIIVSTTDCSGAGDHICTWTSHARPLVGGCPPTGAWTLFPDDACSCRNNVTLTLG